MNCFFRGTYLAAGAGLCFTLFYFSNNKPFAWRTLWQDAHQPALYLALVLSLVAAHWVELLSWRLLKMASVSDEQLALKCLLLLLLLLMYHSIR